MKNKIKKKEGNKIVKEDKVKIIISLVLFFIALLIPFKNILVNNIIYIIAYIIIGLEVITKAFKNIFKGELFDENFLMTIATIGALAIGEFPEAVAVMLFYQIGEMFQDYAVEKSKKSISSLMNIRPDYANLLKNDKIDKVNPKKVKIGEIVVVKPGEKIPLDGIVIEGNSMIDTMALTGEAIPKNANINDEVLSGCINQTGVIKIRVTKEYGESTVSKILDLVENSSNNKSQSENFIRKFAKYYTPIVVGIAVLLAIIPPIIFKETAFIEWLYRALSFLVVSCPCALVISIPLSFFGGIGGASKSGILIKGGNYLEALANTEVIVFDKTGTLTQGVFEVQKINTTKIEENELLKIAAHAEYYSTHPIAQSIKKEYKEEIDENIISNMQEVSGLGISIKVDGKDILIGNEKLMKENGIEYTTCNDIGTIVYIAIDNEYVGNIVIADKIKDDSFKCIEELKSKSKRIVMLTGDRKDIAESIAEKLKIEEVYTELLPNEKVYKVKELVEEKSKNGKLVFIGDGINDAPVLALADIGVAMGSMGSDAAIEAADIVIMNDKPSKLVDGIKISKKTMKIVKQNIMFAITVKIAVLILSALRNIYNVGSCFCRCRSFCTCCFKCIQNIK